MRRSLRRQSILRQSDEMRHLQKNIPQSKQQILFYDRMDINSSLCCEQQEKQLMSTIAEQ